MTSVFVRRDGNETGGTRLVLEAGSNLQTGETKFAKIFGGLTTLESDLLLLAASVFAADRCIKRGDREEFSRAIELSIPAINVGRLQPCREAVEDILRTLSNDAWRLSFRQEPGDVETKFVAAHRNGKTLLFSGGLDSLAAAVDLGRDAELQLVSHITRSQRTSSVQDKLLFILKRLGITLPHRKFLVSATSTYPIESRIIY